MNINYTTRELLEVVNSSDTRGGFLTSMFFNRRNTKTTNTFEIDRYSRGRGLADYVLNEDAEALKKQAKQFERITVTAPTIKYESPVSKAEIRNIQAGETSYSLTSQNQRIDKIITDHLRECMSNMQRGLLRSRFLMFLQNGQITINGECE